MANLFPFVVSLPPFVVLAERGAAKQTHVMRLFVACRTMSTPQTSLGSSSFDKLLSGHITCDHLAASRFARRTNGCARGIPVSDDPVAVGGDPVPARDPSVRGSSFRSWLVCPFVVPAERGAAKQTHVMRLFVACRTMNTPLTCLGSPSFGRLWANGIRLHSSPKLQRNEQSL